MCVFQFMSCFYLFFLFFFFFQAEDGIRDWSVTGVQTCALPISLKTGGSLGASFVQVSPGTKEAPKEPPVFNGQGSGVVIRKERSEERRVGKECRYRWWPDE